MNINFYRKGNMLSRKDSIEHGLNDWAKVLDNKGQVDTFILVLRRPLLYPS